MRYHRRLAGLAAVCVAVIATAAASLPDPVVPDPVLAAAGDIACAPGAVKDATHCHQVETAALLTGASLVLPLGDLQYNSGTLANFTGSYDKSWGQFRGVTKPVPGNHESASKAGYRAYFGYPAAPTPLFYSYDIGGWHVVALDSDQCAISGCASGSQQEAWLRGDLAAHPVACTLAYWHQARWASGSTLTDNTYMATIWADLYAANADVILNGHNHAYERFAPLNAVGARDDLRGMREFIVGTGGEDHAGGTTLRAGSMIRNSATFGVLKLTLHAGTYDWRFTPEAGKTFTDTGSGTCH